MTIDKSKWPDGPWQNEPDELEWIDEATELVCRIKRNSLGALIGYVSLPSSHPWFGKDYQKIGAGGHRGLTYSRLEAADDGAQIYWVGFHCAHYNDFYPWKAFPDESDVYRTIDYVKAECARLAAQAHKALEDA